MLKGCRVIWFRVRSLKNRSEHTRYNNTLTRTQILQVSRPTLADSGCVSENLCVCLHVCVCQRKIYCVWALRMAVFQKHRPKPSNKAELESCAADDMEVFHGGPWIRLSWGFENGCKHVLKLTEDILNMFSNKQNRSSLGSLINKSNQSLHNALLQRVM